MRRVSGILLILLLILGMASPALAADYDLPILRGSSQPPAPVLSVGPATFTRWSGFYVGGNVSFGSATSDFSTAPPLLVDFSLRGLTANSALTPSEKTVSAGAPTSHLGAAVSSVTTRNGKISSLASKRPTRTPT